MKNSRLFTTNRISPYLAIVIIFIVFLDCRNKEIPISISRVVYHGNFSGSTYLLIKKEPFEITTQPQKVGSYLVHATGGGGASEVWVHHDDKFIRINIDTGSSYKDKKSEKSSENHEHFIIPIQSIVDEKIELWPGFFFTVKKQTIPKNNA